MASMRDPNFGMFCSVGGILTTLLEVILFFFELFMLTHRIGQGSVGAQKNFFFPVDRTPQSSVDSNL